MPSWCRKRTIKDELRAICGGIDLQNGTENLEWYRKRDKRRWVSGRYDLQLSPARTWANSQNHHINSRITSSPASLSRAQSSRWLRQINNLKSSHLVRCSSNSSLIFFPGSRRAKFTREEFAGKNGKWPWQTELIFKGGSAIRLGFVYYSLIYILIIKSNYELIRKLQI